MIIGIHGLFFTCDGVTAPLRHTRNMRNTWQLPAKNENGEFPFGCFFPLCFQKPSGAVDLNLGFSYTGFYFENWSRYLGKSYQNIGSSGPALRDMEEPKKAAVNLTVFKED